MTIVIRAGTPVIEKLQDKTSFTRTKNLFLAVNEHIKDVSQEGAGSQRVVPLEIEKGNLRVEEGALTWDMLTEARIVETGSEVDLGDLKITANSDVTAVELTDSYLLQNKFLTIYLIKCEDRGTCILNSTDLIKNITFTNVDSNTEFTEIGGFDIGLSEGSWNYTGFSKLEDSGVNMGSATVLYFINNTDEVAYTIIEFNLESNRDFIQAKIR
ncbi:hypothetical protein HN587_07775 [Candidatus Woesearchaeota archaeon]|nr:hypothetical protein [Candidatus Woesearchaeota archaeon]